MPPRARRPSKAAAASSGADGTALFDKYASAADPNLIDPEGIERLCADLGLDPSDRKVLVMAWTMGAARMGFFTRDEFEAGLRSLGAADAASLAAALPRAAGPTADPAGGPFRSLWDFAFGYLLTEDRQKVVDVPTAAAMAGIALPPGSPHAPTLAAYLADAAAAGNVGGGLSVVTRDAWQGLGRFVGAHPSPAAATEGYDVDGAWPLLVDGYVEWLGGHPAAVAAASEVETIVVE